MVHPVSADQTPAPKTSHKSMRLKLGLVFSVEQHLIVIHLDIQGMRWIQALFT